MGVMCRCKPQSPGWSPWHTHQPSFPQTLDGQLPALAQACSCQPIQGPRGEEEREGVSLHSVCLPRCWEGELMPVCGGHGRLRTLSS